MKAVLRTVRSKLPPIRVFRIVFLVVVPLIAVILGTRWYAQSGRYEETENAYVKAAIVAVSCEVPGRVVGVAVQDNQHVSAGDLLFQVDPAPYQIALDRAKAQMEVIRTDVQSLKADYRTSLLEADEMEEQIRFLTRQFERQAMLRESGMTRADMYDEARHNLELAKRKLVSIRERTQRVIANLAGDPNLPVDEFPRYVEAKAAYDAAAIDLARTEVRAPSAGIVSNLDLEVGEHIDKGVPVFSLISNAPAWVEANYKETQLTHMRVGQHVTVRVDAYPDIEWSALVSSISPATGAEFAVLPPQNATGNWVKVVQRIPVRIEVEQPAGMPPLRAGMTATVAVDTGHVNGLPKTVRRLIDEGYLPRFLQPTPALAGN